jgi:threonine/homoserine/homoserine lactone efflux protein
MEIASSLGVAYVTYFVGTSSPGPANLAIISASLSHGRPAGVATALGVVTGSVMWGLISAFGLGTLLSTWPDLLNALSLFGGFYLCFVAWGAFRKAILGTAPELSREAKADSEAQKKFFLYGIALHLTNPKAMFVWMSIIALGLPKGTGEHLLPLLIVAGCGVIGMFVFGGYAIVFSHEKMAKLYIRASRVINSLIAALFLVAGLSLFYRSIVLLIAF